MESFVIRPTTWPVLRLFSRNPLIRTSDRIDAAAAALAGLLIVIAAACAGVIGTMIHRHPVTACRGMARWRLDRGPMALPLPGVSENPGGR